MKSDMLPMGKVGRWERGFYKKLKKFRFYNFSIQTFFLMTLLPMLSPYPFLFLLLFPHFFNYKIDIKK